MRWASLEARCDEYLLEAAAVMVLTRAIPSMLSQILPTFMQNKMMQIGVEGCDPEEM
jgi:hypothetical protein